MLRSATVSHHRPAALSSTHHISTTSDCRSAQNAFWQPGNMHVSELARFWASYVNNHLPATPFNHYYRYGPDQHAPRRSPSRNICPLRGRMLEEGCVAHTGVRLSKMAKHRTWVTTSVGCANFLLGENTSEEGIGFLATLSHCLNGLLLSNFGLGERPCSTRTARSHMSNRNQGSSRFFMGKCSASDAEAISNTVSSQSSVQWVHG